MGDLEKLQRKLLKQAAERQKQETKAYQKRRKAAEPVEDDPERLYCVRCTALVRADGSCPRCDHGQRNVMAYCRKCMDVHGTQQKCKAWKPADGSDRDRPETYRP